MNVQLFLFSFCGATYIEGCYSLFLIRRALHDRGKLQLPNQPGPAAEPITWKRKLKISIIPRLVSRRRDFDGLLLIGFDKTHLEDQKHLDRMVHFFLYDYRFERVWKNSDNDIEKLSRYRAVLSPDFSMYLEMAPVMQLYIVFVDYKRSSWRYMNYERSSCRKGELEAFKIGGRSTFL